MRLLVGLGNPGDTYANTRHNIGFLALDRIAEDHGFGQFRKRFSSLVADGRIGPYRVLLQKPQTYMNLSGQAVGELVRYHKLERSAITVIHDEIDLAPGKVRVRVEGGIAGHRGLRSLVDHVGGGFRRVRVGVGHPGGRNRVVGHVLGKFGRGDSDWVDPILREISNSVDMLLEGEDHAFASRLGLARRAVFGEESEESQPVAGTPPPAPEQPAGE